MLKTCFVKAAHITLPTRCSPWGGALLGFLGVIDKKMFNKNLCMRSLGKSMSTEHRRGLQALLSCFTGNPLTFQISLVSYIGGGYEALKRRLDKLEEIPMVINDFR